MENTFDLSEFSKQHLNFCFLVGKTIVQCFGLNFQPLWQPFRHYITQYTANILKWLNISHAYCPGKVQSCDVNIKRSFRYFKLLILESIKWSESYSASALLHYKLLLLTLHFFRGFFVLQRIIVHFYCHLYMKKYFFWVFLRKSITLKHVLASFFLSYTSDWNIVLCLCSHDTPWLAAFACTSLDLSV